MKGMMAPQIPSSTSKKPLVAPRLRCIARPDPLRAYALPPTEGFVVDMALSSSGPGENDSVSSFRQALLLIRINQYQSVTHPLASQTHRYHQIGATAAG